LISLEACVKVTPKDSCALKADSAPSLSFTASSNSDLNFSFYQRLEKNIFRWRSIKGDGNCYYRAVIFSYLEDLILDKNILMLKKES
jgi:hypothetical protein